MTDLKKLFANIKKTNQVVLDEEKKQIVVIRQ